MHFGFGFDLHDCGRRGQIEDACHADKKHRRNRDSDPGDQGKQQHRQAQRKGAKYDVAHADQTSVSDNQGTHDGTEAENRVENREDAASAVQSTVTKSGRVTLKLYDNIPMAASMTKLIHNNGMDIT